MLKISEKKKREQGYYKIHNWLRYHCSKKKCEHCGSLKNLEFALKKGKKHEKKEENYLHLCTTCHYTHDYTAKRSFVRVKVYPENMLLRMTVKEQKIVETAARKLKLSKSGVIRDLINKYL